MKALSVKQPWAYLLLAGVILPGIPPKRIENRDWPLPSTFKLPQTILIHASKTLDLDAWEWIDRNIGWELGAHLDLMDNKHEFPLGAIIGKTDIVGQMSGERAIHPGTPAIWYVGKFGFVTDNPAFLPEPIPYRGQLGFFEVNL